MNLMYRICSIGYYGSTLTYQLWKRTTSLLDSERGSTRYRSVLFLITPRAKRLPNYERSSLAYRSTILHALALKLL